MKILVFEYITGGGCNRQALPEELANEGRLMLQAVLDDFADLSGVELTVMLDERLFGLIDLRGFKSRRIASRDDSLVVFESLLATADAVWPLAPETGGLLKALCLAVERLGKHLLTSPASAVAVTGDKYLTFRRLCEHGIATVPTVLAEHAVERPFAGACIVKAIDGVGCEDSFIVGDGEDWPALLSGQGRTIVQPLLHGVAVSLSCLFKQGRVWPLCVNLQSFDRLDRRFRLAKITVNHQPVQEHHLELAAKIAVAFPELWGYVGIDLIETPEQVLALEINPRLTTSYAGIRASLGINVAAAVLTLQTGSPLIEAINNARVDIIMKKDKHETV